MEQFFILGRNPELSKAEIVSYLTARNIKFAETLFKDNFLILNIEQPIDIQNLGGTIKSGKIEFRGNIANFKKFIDSQEIIPADKFSYALIGNFEDFEDWLIDKFKEDGKKAMIRRGHKELKIQEGERMQVPNADFQILCFFHQDICFGLVDQEYDYSQVKERDMKKPVRRESLAISPRLSKILINLSQAKTGQLLLDPFCGVGGVLQEALIQGINALGIDKDQEAIIAAKQNLRWIEKKYKITSKYELLALDSRNAPNRQFDAIACEPSLGQLVKKRPSEYESKEIVFNFQKQITPILAKLKKIKKQDAKIAITFPFIGNISVNVNKLCFETGLQVYKIPGTKLPIKEFRPEQFISREIYVFV